MTTGGSGTSGTFSMSSFSTQSDMFDMSELFSASSIYKGVGASGTPGAASRNAVSDVYSGLMVVDSRDGEELLGAENFRLMTAKPALGNGSREQPRWQKQKKP